MLIRHLIKGAYLDHTFYPALVQERGDADEAGDALAQARCDLDIVFGYVLYEYLLLLECGLADQPLAHLKPVRHGLPLLVGVAAHQRQRRSGPILREIKGAHLGVEVSSNLRDHSRSQTVDLRIAPHDVIELRNARLEPVFHLHCGPAFPQRLRHFLEGHAELVLIRPGYYIDSIVAGSHGIRLAKSVSQGLNYYAD